MLSEEILSKFQNTPSDYRPAPLWVWNDIMTKEQIEFQLKELQSHGFGGAFVHPRPGLVTEYLSEEWFELWGYALEVAEKLDIKLNIYDENSYPSGFGGGYVSSVCPEALATNMQYLVVVDPAQAPGARLAAYAATEKDGVLTELKNVLEKPDVEWKNYGNTFIVITAEQQAPKGWQAGYAHVDLLRPQTTKEFLKITHEQYYKHFGKNFGNTIAAIFTDEPSAGQNSCTRLPFSFWFANEFKKRKGYDLLKNLPCVFANLEGDCFDHPAEKIRFDYFDTVHELWIKNNIEVIAKWCEEHNINWTGHYYEHLWPSVSLITSPAIQSIYEYHQWPAIDMLLASYLRDTPTHSIAHTIRELKSAANQFGKKRAVCELYGSGGWDSTFDDYKRMSDWVMVNGVNFINQHLTYSTIMGARKCDHPQSFDWRQPWWNEYAVMNDYLSRASYMLSQGKMEQRILVLNPALTAYIVEPSKFNGNMFSDGSVNCITNPDMSDFLSLCQRLTTLQWDYDLGDEYTLARHAKVSNCALEVVNQRYSCVIVSGSMKNMLESTAQLIKSCEENGVTVIATGTPGKYIEGVLKEELYAELASGWVSLKADEIDNCLGDILTRRLTASVPFPEGFDHMRRKLENGSELWFFANQAMDTYEADITLPGCSAEQLELFSGEVKALSYNQNCGSVMLHIKLARNQSLMVITSTDKKYLTKAEKAKPTKKVDLELCGITRECENCYPILYADYNEYKDTYVMRLCDKIYREHGFASDPWNKKVQFRRNIISRDSDYDETSAFSVSYHFFCENGFVPQKISAVAEHPEYCYLKVNGKNAPWNLNETWLDHHFGVADISEYVVHGENVVEIVADVFHVLMELQPIYLKGDFSVKDENGKWVLSEIGNIAYGSWKMQGLPFYPWAVRYNYRFYIKELPEIAELDMPCYNATAISVFVNGNDFVLMHADGKVPTDISDFLVVGENNISVRVCGSHRNLLGPHFPRVNEVFAEIGSWLAATPEHTPPAKQFKLFDYGLYDAPTLTIG